MTEPEFKNYSQTQLLQILGRIDAARFPERVKVIEARLAELAHPPVQDPGAAHATSASSAELEPVARDAFPDLTVAGTWRRIGAFCIDMLILCIIGMLAGALLHAQFAALGRWGILVGVAVTLLYFGLTEGRPGGGQSLGMRLLGLRVVSRTGDPLGTPSAFLRSAIFCAAYFLNGAQIDPGFAGEWGAVGMSMAIFGLIFCVFYLLIFNRRTRQSFHDLAVGAFVVRAGPGHISLPTGAVWKGHFVVIATVLLALFGGTAVFSSQSSQGASLRSLIAIQQQVGAIGGVGQVSVFLNETTSAQGTRKFLLINAVTDSTIEKSEAFARRIALTALENYAEASQQDAIRVTLSSGYNIGIASMWTTIDYVHTPADWHASPGVPRT